MESDHTSKEDLVKELIVQGIAARTHRSEREAREAYEGEYARLECISKVKEFISVIAIRNARDSLLGNER